eukprot:scaffold53138_cov60-Phaeocystis_antarctica.AAC.1
MAPQPTRALSSAPCRRPSSKHGANTARPCLPAPFNQPSFAMPRQVGRLSADVERSTKLLCQERAPSVARSTSCCHDAAYASFHVYSQPPPSALSATQQAIIIRSRGR